MTTRVFGGSRVETFHGAANGESPLFRRDWNFSLALGLSWSFYRSERTAASSAGPFGRCYTVCEKAHNEAANTVRWLNYKSVSGMVPALSLIHI